MDEIILIGKKMPAPTIINTSEKMVAELEKSLFLDKIPLNIKYMVCTQKIIRVQVKEYITNKGDYKLNVWAECEAEILLEDKYFQNKISDEYR